jgi:hypothetical protein
MNSKIRATSLGRLARVDRRCCVADHCWRGSAGERQKVGDQFGVTVSTTLP